MCKWQERRWYICSTTTAATLKYTKDEFKGRLHRSRLQHFTCVARDRRRQCALPSWFSWDPWCRSPIPQPGVIKKFSLTVKKLKFIGLVGSLLYCAAPFEYHSITVLHRFIWKFSPKCTGTGKPFFRESNFRESRRFKLKVSFCMNNRKSLDCRMSVQKVFLGLP